MSVVEIHPPPPMPCSTTAVQGAVNSKVTGSNPVGAVWSLSSAVERLPYKQNVTGSIPVATIVSLMKQTSLPYPYGMVSTGLNLVK